MSYVRHTLHTRPEGGISRMTSINDVAAYVLATFENSISTMKLQKLCYMAQGWNLALADDALFGDEFEAWKRGPVSRELYRNHRREFSVSRWPMGNPAELSERDRVVVDGMLRNYGALSGVELSELTHQEGTPWSLTRSRAGVRDGESSTETISKSDIKTHFREKLGLDTHV